MFIWHLRVQKGWLTWTVQILPHSSTGIPIAMENRLFILYELVLVKLKLWSAVSQLFEIDCIYVETSDSGTCR